MSDIYDQALNELAQEVFREKVEREKKRLRARRSLWQRIKDLIPFNITRKRKP